MVTAVSNTVLGWVEPFAYKPVNDFSLVLLSQLRGAALDLANVDHGQRTQSFPLAWGSDL